MSIVVQRSGVTARHYNREDTKTTLSEGKMPGHPARRGARIHFTMASKGGGESDVLVSISPQDFAQVAELMFEADQNAAIKAFAAVMQDGID